MFDFFSLSLLTPLFYRFHGIMWTKMRHKDGADARRSGKKNREEGKKRTKKTSAGIPPMPPRYRSVIFVIEQPVNKRPKIRTTPTGSPIETSSVNVCRTNSKPGPPFSGSSLVLPKLFLVVPNFT